MQIRIEGYDLPGLVCAAGANFPGYESIHVAVQGRAPKRELLGLTAGNANAAAWTVDCDVRQSAAGFDFKGPHIQGRRRDRP